MMATAAPATALRRGQPPRSRRAALPSISFRRIILSHTPPSQQRFRIRFSFCDLTCNYSHSISFANAISYAQPDGAKKTRRQQFVVLIPMFPLHRLVFYQTPFRRHSSQVASRGSPFQMPSNLRNGTIAEKYPSAATTGDKEPK